MRPVLIILACLGCTTPIVDTPPNIVLIYVDDLGWRDLGVQGSRYYETPNVDLLAAQGMRFTDAYANAPNCAPSRAALLSGQYAPRTGVYTVGAADRGRTELRALVPVANRTELSLDVVTISEMLAEAGYATGHAGNGISVAKDFFPQIKGSNGHSLGTNRAVLRATFILISVIGASCEAWKKEERTNI